MAYLNSAKEKEAKKKEQIFVIARHMTLRKHAHNIQMKKALGIKKIASAVDGELKKGDIYHIGMAQVYQIKVDENNETLVVVDISKSGGY